MAQSLKSTMNHIYDSCNCDVIVSSSSMKETSQSKASRSEKKIRNYTSSFINPSGSILFLRKSSYYNVIYIYMLRNNCMTIFGKVQPLLANISLQVSFLNDRIYIQAFSVASEILRRFKLNARFLERFEALLYGYHNFGCHNIMAKA